VQVRGSQLGQPWILLDGRAEPSDQPFRRQRAARRSEPPRTAANQDLCAVLSEQIGCDVDRVRTEQLPPSGGTPLVSVERLNDGLVEPVGWSQIDATDDGESDERRAPSLDARCNEAAQLVLGQHVEERRGGDRGRSGEISRHQPGDVPLMGLGGDPSPTCGDGRHGRRRVCEQRWVAVVQNPMLRSVELRRQPASHRAGAAA